MKGSLGGETGCHGPTTSLPSFFLLILEEVCFPCSLKDSSKQFPPPCPRDLSPLGCPCSLRSWTTNLRALSQRVGGLSEKKRRLTHFRIYVKIHSKNSIVVIFAICTCFKELSGSSLTRIYFQMRSHRQAPPTGLVQ